MVPQVQYNMLTDTYDTRDGTKVSAILIDSLSSLADVLFIAILRDEQRKQRKAREQQCAFHRP